MTDTSRYIALLAKVMRSKNLPGEGSNKEKYNKLYFAIHSELNEKLRKSQYPYTSDIIKKTKDMLDTMEALYLCPELVGKRCFLISNHITTSIFKICNAQFKNLELTSNLERMYVQIPFVISDTEDTDTIEVLNYANIRITLSVSELKFLIVESGKRKIALNRIIQLIIIKTKLNDPSLCIISDNIYSTAEKLFGRAVSKRITCIDERDVPMLDRRRIDRNSLLLMSEEVYKKTIDMPSVDKYNKILIHSFDKYITNEACTVLYGLWEEYIAIETQITDYYEKQILESRNTLQKVKADIVLIEDRQDQTLQSIRSFEENRQKNLKSEETDIINTLKYMDGLVGEICNDFGETLITGKFIAQNTIDDIFDAFFRCENFNNGLGKKILSRIYSYGYSNYALVTAYVQLMSGIKVQYEPISIERHEWEKAKILIAIIEPEQIPNYMLTAYIKALDKRCHTGKELYAKALTMPEERSQGVLQESLRKGYAAAGKKLLNMYNSGHREINLQTLANALVPEACMILADQKMARYNVRKGQIKLSDREFTYYKIAAANQYLPAVGKIVDTVFNLKFSSGFQIPKKEHDDSKYKELIEYGHIICQLCNFLTAKMYRVEHYNEICGVVYFCLNENLSEAMSKLTNINSALALYCKGNMYEFGGGVAVDLDLAVENYKKSLTICHVEKVENRLTACQRKISRREARKAKKDYYHSDEDYHSTSTYTGSSTVDDGCFMPGTKILMADGSVQAVESLSVNDEVWVFDHYSGKLIKERIIANVHENSEERIFDIIRLIFDDDTKLEIVRSHSLFDISENQYVWINADNAEQYVGHLFASISNGEIVPKKLTNYFIESKSTRYYMPISRFHLNVFAEGILAMPPTKITTNMFKFKSNMCYDLSDIQKYGLTPYNEIKHIVSYEEYMNLPCKYLYAVLAINNLTSADFEYAIKLFREQLKYAEYGESTHGE